MHPVHRCGLLLQMSYAYVAWSVCLLGIRASCAKTAEPIEMALGVVYVSRRNHVLDIDKCRRNYGDLSIFQNGGRQPP